MKEDKTIFNKTARTTRSSQEQRKVYQCSCMNTKDRIAMTKPDYGKFVTVHQRFMRWQRKDMWKKLFEI